MLNTATHYKERFYRQWVNFSDLYRYRISAQESDIEIFTDCILEEEFLRKRVLFYRQQIKDYIVRDRRFLVWLKPLAVEKNTFPIVRDMAQAAEIANVGPMASVAGAIAQYLGKAVLAKGAKEVIVENGGDIFLKIRKTRFIGIYAGESKFSGKLFLKITPQQSIHGICTSSATVSHSLSFGNADAVTILAKDAIIADALATAACNLVKTENDFNRAIDFVKKIKMVYGIIIILKDKLASWGKVEFV